MKRLINITTKAVIVAAMLATCLDPVTAAGPVAVKAGRVIPIAGEAIENAVILIEDGKIVAVGPDVEIPVEAKVIDATDKVVMPGFVDAHNPSGMSQANERNTNVPFLSAVDSIDPVLDFFEDSRRNGVTTAAVFPGNSTMIGGRGAVLKTAGSYVDDMLLKREAGLKISLRPFGGSRMSHLARLRRELEKAKTSLEDKDAETPEDESTDSPSDEKQVSEEKTEEGGAASGGENGNTGEQAPNEAEVGEGLLVLQRLLKGELPAFIYCDAAMDVGQAIRLVEQYKLDAVLVLGSDCYKAAEMLAKLEKPVILDPTLVFWETDPMTREDKKIIVPAVMMEAGLSFVFQADNSGTRQNLGQGFLWYQAATGVKYGMSESDALRALTLTPAELLGVDEFVGSIEPGKDADLVILSGDPLNVSTWVEKTLVAGEIVYDRSTDQKLKRLLEEPAE